LLETEIIITDNPPESGILEPASFNCRFSAMPSADPFRPERTTPRPMVRGPQTAVVVGPGGDEIYTDKYGRVKVQFHWDRDGKKDQNASCWVRVAQVWAGKNWGWMTVPRIGQEVIVDFLEGDPDRPIVTGRVYNAEQMPPWALPANKTQSGILTRSSPGGSVANANQLRFEDKKGGEQVYLHAEKNQDIEVENDETHWVGHDRRKTIDHDETSLIKHDHTEKVGNNENIIIGVNRTENVGSNETVTIALMRTHTIGVNDALTVGAAQEVKVGATRALTVGASQTVNVGAGHKVSIGSDQSMAVGGAETRTTAEARSTRGDEDDALQVGKNEDNDAGDSVTIKTGSASITMKKDGSIAIKGKDISIDSSGKVNVRASGNIVMKGSKILQN